MSKTFYNKDDIKRIFDRIDEIRTQYQNLSKNIVMRDFASAKGSEFATHGFLRRCAIMYRCIEKTFENLPPDLEGLPDKENVDDATIFLHCFIINVFGACDNLAWIIVYEKNITKPDGSPIPSTWVGLRSVNRLVRNHLSARTIDALDRSEEWFKHIDVFRHSLAHRISLYVPPYNVSPDRAEDYHILDAQRWHAISNKDFNEAERLDKEQDKLKIFRPWIMHSFSERSPVAIIHPQMLADFGMVLELGEKIFRELELPFTP